MCFHLTYTPWPPPQHHTGPTSMSGSVNLVNIFYTDLFFLSHVVILNWNIFRNTPLQTFAKKITYLKWSRGIPLWCQEHMPETVLGGQSGHTTWFCSSPPHPQTSSPNTCAWSEITSTMSMIAVLQTTRLQVPDNYPRHSGGASKSVHLFHSCAQ